MDHDARPGPRGRGPWHLLAAGFVVLLVVGGGFAGALEGLFHGEGTRPWSLARISEDGRRLVVAVELGACDDGARVVARAPAEAVRIEVHRLPSPICGDTGRSADDLALVEVALPEPLGDRPLTGCDLGPTRRDAAGCRVRPPGLPTDLPPPTLRVRAAP